MLPSNLIKANISTSKYGPSKKWRAELLGGIGSILSFASVFHLRHDADGLFLWLGGAVSLELVYRLLKGVPQIVLSPIGIKRIDAYKSREWRWVDVGPFSVDRVKSYGIWKYSLCAYSDRHYDLLVSRGDVAEASLSDADVKISLIHLAVGRNDDEAYAFAETINDWRDRHGAPSINIDIEDIQGKVAEKGDVEAQYNLGLLHEIGQAVPQDYSLASQWYLKAASPLESGNKPGDVRAQFALGLFYLKGTGVVKNISDAAKWFHMAADQGHVVAQYNLGELYKNGRGVPKDLADAAEWYRRSAGGGYAKAQFKLGVLYQLGQGFTQNDREAVRWFRMAAEQGEASARSSLGEMYQFGKGVDLDYSEAIRWYRMAAEKNITAAQYNLGFMYENGQGVSCDLVTAYVWYSIAESKENESAKKGVKRLIMKMTSKQIGDAKIQVREKMKIIMNERHGL